MKKVLLGILLGFILNSGLRSYHNYLWWKTESTISNEEMNKSYERCGYFCAIQEKSPSLVPLAYVLVYPYYRPNGTLVIQFP